MKLTLLGENLWRYISEGKEMMNRAEYGTLAPALSESPTEEELSKLDKFTANSL
jgi:hypothetical protein